MVEYLLALREGSFGMTELDMRKCVKRIHEGMECTKQTKRAVKVEEKCTPIERRME
jgi:hypothetical protein